MPSISKMLAKTFNMSEKSNGTPTSANKTTEDHGAN